MCHRYKGKVIMHTNYHLTQKKKEKCENKKKSLKEMLISEKKFHSRSRLHNVIRVEIHFILFFI